MLVKTGYAGFYLKHLALLNYLAGDVDQSPHAGSTSTVTVRSLFKIVPEGLLWPAFLLRQRTLSYRFTSANLTGNTLARCTSTPLHTR